MHEERREPESDEPPPGRTEEAEPEHSRRPAPGVKHEPEPDAENLIPTDHEPGTF